MDNICVEVRLKVPMQQGAWSVVWMLSANNSLWPQCGEIDIIE